MYLTIHLDSLVGLDILLSRESLLPSNHKANISVLGVPLNGYNLTVLGLPGGWTAVRLEPLLQRGLESDFQKRELNFGSWVLTQVTMFTVCGPHKSSSWPPQKLHSGFIVIQVLST